MPAQISARSARTSTIAHSTSSGQAVAGGNSNSPSTVSAPDGGAAELPRHDDAARWNDDDVDHARHRLHRAEIVDAEDLAADLGRHAQHGRLRVRHGEVHGELLPAGHDVARVEPPGEMTDHLVLRRVLRLRA